ncbi:MAG: prepilin-type N-terminal cleavage/methylation domain-containing protein [Pirellulales bacterium]
MPSYSLTPRARSLRSRRRLASVGFTLTEVLVVIAILAILAALGTVGVMRAMDTARQSRIKIEVDNLDAALKDYKAQFGSYPPCDFRTSDPIAFAALRSHVARRFPRYNLNNLAADLGQTGLDLTNFRPDQALVFWLKGSSPDVTNPFVDLNGNQLVNGTPGTQMKITPLFEFDVNRLVPLTAGTHPSYVPPGSKNNAPYVYFDGAWLTQRFNATQDIPWDPSPYVTEGTPGLVRAYYTDTNNDKMVTLGTDQFINMDSCQLIAPGLDGKYSSLAATAYPLYPLGTPFDLTYDDNIANFCERARLGDAKP